MGDLSSILSDPVETEEAAPVEAAQAAAEVVAPEVEATGEIEAAAPAVVAQEDEHRTKGLEAALMAERRKRQEVEQALHHLQQQPAKPSNAAPDPAEYQDNPQEYWRLVARHEAREELRAAVAQAQEAKARQDQADRVNDVVKQGQAKYPDFDTSINSGLGPFLTPQFAQAIAGCERGSDVSYYLAKHPGDASRISQMHPLDMVRELTKLDVKLSQQAPAQQAQVPQTLTQARDSRGQFTPALDGPKPLEAILAGRSG